MTTQQPILLTQPVPAVRRFGKYYLVRKLAEGGMAEIYLAKQVGAEGFERDVVIKCMLDHFSKSREFVDMFLDEARLAAHLHHPNIVQITDLGAEGGRYFICMEYLPGEDLQAIIDRCAETRRSVPIALATKMILGACEGLEFAHGYREGGQLVNLVHRDVSPSNIIVTYQGTVKVLDFGIAKASSKLVQTQPGLLKGKLGYMSPEQASGDALDARSDLFSLGVTFHELLTGQRVFQRDNEIGVLMALMRQSVPPPSQMRPEVPAALDRIVLRALARAPAERYRDAAEMRGDLEAFLSSINSVPGATQLAHYMQSLFGQEQADRKMRIPSVKEIFGEEVPPAPAEGEGRGIEPTVVRSRVTDLVASAPPPVPSAPTVAARLAREPADQVVQPVRSRRGPALLGALLAVLLIGGGGAAAFWFLRAPPVVPPPPPPQVAQPTPVEAPVEVPVEAPVPAPSPVAEVSPSPAPEEPAPVATPVEPSPAPRPARPIWLTPKEIGAVLGRSKDDIKACFERHRTALPATVGQVHITLTIQNSGAVSAVRVITEGLEANPLSACLVRVVKAVRFPRNNNKPAMTISVPFKYGTAGG